MMRLGLRSTLAAALLLLASVGTASAECAWVLWAQQTFLYGGEGKIDPWLLIEAAATQPSCKDMLARTIQRVAKPKAGVKVEVTDNVVTKTTSDAQGNSATFVYRYACLPDTIDPRGPKGK